MRSRAGALIAYLALSLGLFACLAWLLFLGYLGGQAATALARALAAVTS